MSTEEKKQKSLNVLFFSHSSQLVGAERSLLEFTRQLIEGYRINCSVVIPDEGPLKEKLGEAGASVITINYHWWCDTDQLTSEERVSRFVNSLTNIGNNLQELREINPDVIYTNTLLIPWGAVTASLLCKPHVWFVAEFGEQNYMLNFPIPFKTMLKIIEGSSNLVLVNSDALKNTLFGDNPAESVEKVCYYIDIPPETIQDDGTYYFTDKEAVKLIISGTIMEIKGQKEAVLAVKELIQRDHNVELIIMGPANPAYLKQLKEMVRNDNLERYIKFMDFKINPYPVVNQADIVLVCSHVEAFGRVTLEAMLLKKPVIGADTGGTAEQIREGYNGLLYPPGDYHRLTDKIEYLIQHREKMKEFGENGYKFATEEFTKEKSGSKLVDLLWKVKDSANPLSADLFQLIVQNTIENNINLLSSIQNKDLQIVDRDNEIASQRAQIADRDNEIASQRMQLADRDNEIASQRAQITAIQESLSWRLTRPLRFIWALFHTSTLGFL